MRWLLVLALCLLGMASAQISYGVKLTLELPADAGLLDFVANPLCYATSRLDVVDIRAFGEAGRFGLEARYKSATTAYVGGYYILGLQSLFGQSAESTVGVYVGRDFRGARTYLSLRGSILLYGSIPQKPP